MRKNQIKGVVHDFLWLYEYRTPLLRNSFSNKLKLNLLTGEIIGTDNEELIKFYKEKRKWFKNRIKKLKGNLKDFDSAKVLIFGNTEKIEILYKGKSYSGKLVTHHNKYLGFYTINIKLSWKEDTK